MKIGECYSVQSSTEHDG